MQSPGESRKSRRVEGTRKFSILIESVAYDIYRVSSSQSFSHEFKGHGVESSVGAIDNSVDRVEIANWLIIWSWRLSWWLRWRVSWWICWFFTLSIDLGQVKSLHESVAVDHLSSLAIDWEAVGNEWHVRDFVHRVAKSEAHCRGEIDFLDLVEFGLVIPEFLIFVEPSI